MKYVAFKKVYVTSMVQMLSSIRTRLLPKTYMLRIGCVVMLLRPDITKCFYRCMSAKQHCMVCLDHSNFGVSCPNVDDEANLKV